MSIKSFVKSFSIYGLIPIFGKFISILLLPLYTRLLSPSDYGAQDILVQLAIFLTFLINLEMYSGVGRYFYERINIVDKKKLISTGLWLTIVFSLIVISLALLFNDSIYKIFFETDVYRIAFYLTILWAPISALYTYFLVVMRYEKKPKLYFVLTNVQLMIRILSTVLFVAVFKLGVTGVILGHIVGETSSVLMFGFVLRNYFGLYLSKFDLKAILGFSLPLVPAVLIISFQKPLIRYLVVNYLSIVELGYYTIAIQIAGILSFVQFGLKMSWQPHLFELLQNDHYESEVRKIYNLFLGIAGLVCFLIITNGRLLLQILTTPSYYSAAPIIGFVVMDSLIEIIRQISGCGPAVAKKTQYETYYELCASVVSVLFFLAFYKYIGIIGLAIAFLGGTLIKFVLSWILTRKFTDIRIDALPTCLLLLFLLSISIIYAVINISIVTSIVFSILVGGAYFYVKKSEIFNGCKYINGKISRAIAIKRN